MDQSCFWMFPFITDLNVHGSVHSSYCDNWVSSSYYTTLLLIVCSVHCRSLSLWCFRQMSVPLYIFFSFDLPSICIWIFFLVFFHLCENVEDLWIIINLLSSLSYLSSLSIVHSLWLWVAVFLACEHLRWIKLDVFYNCWTLSSWVL